MQLQWKKEWTTPSVIGVGSFLIGVGAGYILNDFRKKRESIIIDRESIERQKQFDYILTATKNTIDSFKNAGRKFIDEVYEDVESTIEETHKVLDGSGNEIITVSTEEVPDKKPINVFETSHTDDDWDYTEEVKHRSPNNPYVLHVDEYMANENEWSQTTLTYYKGDNILCDENDVPIYQWEKITGELKFGHGSKDISIVYIRNEYLQAEYEILLEHGYFQAEILGQDIQDGFDNKEMKHSRNRKFIKD